jgi:photosystem II stability/assembly factor-like uncharacterized protein
MAVFTREGWILCGTLKDNGKYDFLQSYLLHTDNIGESWTTIDLRTGRQMRRMHFANSKQGWVVGEDGIILHTKDAGKTWEQQTYPRDSSSKGAGSRPKLMDVDFRGKDKGIIVGKFGTILRTDDGGERWVAVAPPRLKAESLSFERVQMIDENRAWIVGWEGSILQTINGGRSWIKQNSPSKSRLYAIFMSDRNHGWAAGTKKTLLRYDSTN